MSRRRLFHNVIHACPRWGCRALPAVLLVVIASCGRSDRVAVYPVEGSVHCQGKPAKGALVVFHPQDASQELQRLRPAGTVDADGRFVLATYEPKDGAPEGEYRVTVIWPGPSDGERPRPDRLGRRYANPQESPLTATVTADVNRIEPFKLQQP